MDDQEEHFKAVVIGAGCAGIIAACNLKMKGYEDFVVLEKSENVGGTWLDNTYPGCGCDVPSHLYSFSFNLNPNWSRLYSGQEEIYAYLVDTTKKFGVGGKFRCGTEVKEAVWDEEREIWRLLVVQGIKTSHVTCKVLIGALGGLNIPRYPKIPGLPTFKGKVMHTARWDHTYDLTDKRVAVVGTGATAVQVVPAIESQCKTLAVYQRTPNWIPLRFHSNYSALAKWIFRHIPFAMRLHRWRYWLAGELGYHIMDPRSWMHKAVTALFKLSLWDQVRDDKLRARITPKHALGCKRITPSDDFYKTLLKPHVTLVSDGIVAIDDAGIIDDAGNRHDLDCVILATGYDSFDVANPYKLRIVGRDGRDLESVWSKNGVEALRATTVHGFPNLLFLYGPNSGLAHLSQICQLESQMGIVMPLLREVLSDRVGSFEAREEAQREYNGWLQRRFVGKVWTTPGCKSRYMDAGGSIRALWPGYAISFLWLTAWPRWDEYSFTKPKKS
ncbi:hypothetical protein HK101_000554 [Irineochytrium annulatum]|nr:hypothetical protein HK101_000554 [Irineochytrium annulatum]